MQEVKFKDVDYKSVIRSLIRLILVILIASICAVLLISAVKPKVTEAYTQQGNLVYTGTEQIPEMHAKSEGKELTYRLDYKKSGQWIGEECGTYAAVVTGINKYSGEKVVEWNILQGQVVFRSAEYKNGEILATATLPYTNAYVQFDLIDKNGKAVATQRLNGVQKQGKTASINFKDKITPGKYKIRATAVSLTKYKDKNTGEIIKVIETKQGKAKSWSQEISVENKEKENVRQI